MKSEYDFFGLKQGVFYSSFDELNVILKQPKPIGCYDPDSCDRLLKQNRSKSLSAQQMNEERKEDLALNEALKNGCFKLQSSGGAAGEAVVMSSRTMAL